jgi:ring-1,2-phenylacetyl-CoA epoxidase subunit PaaE
VPARLPRSWNAALEQLRRDVKLVARRATGYGPPPLVPRPLTLVRLPTDQGQVASGARANARELRVARVVRETPSAVTLVLRDPQGRAFDFLPGQFFTLLVEIDGEVVPRNYSASSVPGSAELHLTIKRKTDGRVSPLLCRTTAGDRLRVLGPFGSFVVGASSVRTTPRRIVLLAGGAGITPLASIARTVLDREPDAEVALVYANRSDEEIIFASELDALATAHAGRLTVVHVSGLLDRTATSRALDSLPIAAHPEARFFVCGPDGMRDEVVAALAARKIAEEAIAIERFAIGPRPHVATSSAAIAASVAPGARPIAIRVKDRTHRTTALPGATVLEAGLAAGAPMPFSCAVGGCGACKVKLVEGDVELDEPNCLTDAERAAGFVLACIGRPCGPCIVEVPDDVNDREEN